MRQPYSQDVNNVRQISAKQLLAKHLIISVDRTVCPLYMPTCYRMGANSFIPIFRFTASVWIPEPPFLLQNIGYSRYIFIATTNPLAI